MISLDLGKVAFIRSATGEHRIGFGSGGLVAAWPRREQRSACPASWWRREPLGLPPGSGSSAASDARGRLHELAAAPGERMLEIGAGDRLLRPRRRRVGGPRRQGRPPRPPGRDPRARDARAGEAAWRTCPTQCDATAMPYEDGSFDAAYLAVLGEIPDQDAALRELRAS